MKIFVACSILEVLVNRTKKFFKLDDFEKKQNNAKVTEYEGCLFSVAWINEPLGH